MAAGLFGPAGTRKATRIECCGWGFKPWPGTPPALTLTATDGYANAYRDEAGFQQVAWDFWTILREEGEEAVRSHRREGLNEASQQGSGDGDLLETGRSPFQ